MPTMDGSEWWQKIKELTESGAIRIPRWNIQEINEETRRILERVNRRRRFGDAYQSNIPSLEPTYLVVCGSEAVFWYWLQFLTLSEISRFQYLYTLQQLYFRNSDNTRILLLEDWRSSPALRYDEVWKILNRNFSGWDNQSPVEYEIEIPQVDTTDPSSWPWQNATEAGREINTLINGSISQIIKRMANHPEVDKQVPVATCTRCVYLLAGYPTSACNALRSLPENLTTENNCPDFERR